MQPTQKGYKEIKEQKLTKKFLEFCKSFIFTEWSYAGRWNGPQTHALGLPDTKAEFSKDNLKDKV